jgi:hypothetical protein
MVVLSSQHISSFHRKFIVKSLFIAFLIFPLLAFSQANTRRTEKFDFDWKFLLGDTAVASAIKYDDS